MKILFDHPNPFLLAHGGFQIQIEQTQAALRTLEVDVEPLRWWDDAQKADIIHFFGRMSSSSVEMAHKKGIKVVMAELLTGQGSRSKHQLLFQRAINWGIERFAPRQFTTAFRWESYRLADALVALTAWEAHLMRYLFRAPADRIHILPNGVEPVFLESTNVQRRRWLVCTATITERKRVLELAEAAARAKTPLWIIGKPYAETDPYVKQFRARIGTHPQLLRYEGPINDRQKLASVYREARGFVLLSTMETRSLAAEEAAACGCPLMLADLPWAQSVFGGNAFYCSSTASVSQIAVQIRRFYDAAPSLKSPPKPIPWIQVGRQLKQIYEGLVKTSR